MMRTLGAYIIMNTTLGHDLSQNPIRIIRPPAPPNIAGMENETTSYRDV